jgi:glutamine cyclotransferase
LLALSVSHCSKNKDDFFSFNESKIKAQYTTDEKVALEILNPKEKVIDSVVYMVNDKKIGAIKNNTPFQFDLKNQKFGYQNIKSITYFEGTNEVDSTRIEVISNVQPKLINYTILKTYPHNINSFTEGLEFYKDTLYESAGQYGKSKLLKTDYKTGLIIKSMDLESKYFGEGITIINDKIYQLTYREKVGFIYDAKTWKLIKTFPYTKKEGWGMTNDGKNIYLNDSTEKIWLMNPDTQQTFDYINIYSGGTKIKEVNELEWIDGKIYSNIWQKDAIAIINPKNGAVEGVINLVDLKKKITNPEADVLNGIAYNSKTKTIFVTGKNWDKMFEIKLLN